jgi:biopolymer transport protein ExbD
MPRRRFLAEPEQPTQINITPMIDVTFSILAFFILSTLSLTKLETLSVNLPQAKNAQPQLMAKASLTINQQGEIFLNRQPIPADRVAEAIQQLQPSDQQPLTVIFNADQAINYGNAVSILDQIRQVPGVKVAIATKKISDTK